MFIGKEFKLWLYCRCSQDIGSPQRGCTTYGIKSTQMVSPALVSTSENTHWLYTPMHKQLAISTNKHRPVEDNDVEAKSLFFYCYSQGSNHSLSKTWMYSISDSCTFAEEIFCVCRLCCKESLIHLTEYGFL